MKKMRLQLHPDRTLRTRSGEIVGTLESLTVELDTSFLSGGKGATASPSENSTDSGQASLLPNEARDEGSGEKGETPEAARARRRAEVTAQIDDVWGEYVRVMEPKRQEAGEEERRIIREALKVATPDECKAAIRGCKASRFHMGDNDRRKRYNALSQILKGKRGGKTTREQIDMFLEIAAKSGVESRFTSADPARVRQAKRDVLDAYEFPGDENVVARGEESASWLAAQGFKIEYEESGRPTFRVDDSAA